VISIGEIERGIAQQRAADPGFAESLAAWLDRVLALYGERVLAFDLQTARRWSILSAALGNPAAGLMIAATALEHGPESRGDRISNPKGGRARPPSTR